MAERISKENFEEKVIHSELPVIVDFYSDSCVACKKLSPVLGDIEDDYEGRVNVYKVNTNYDEDLARENGIAANPTLLIFINGEKVAKRVGAANKRELEDWLLANI